MQVNSANQTSLAVRERWTFESDGGATISSTVPCPWSLTTIPVQKCNSCQFCQGVSYSWEADGIRMNCRFLRDGQAPEKPSVVVASLMSNRVDCISQDAGLEVLDKMLLHHDSLIIPVVDGDGTVQGSVTAPAVISSRQQTGSKHSASTIRDVMTRSPFALLEHTDILQAAATLSSQGVTQLPIVDERNVLVGIVRTADVVRTATALPSEPI
jgi:CBS domain-containing protein